MKGSLYLIHSQTLSGLQTLLCASIPTASHHSSARYPPPRCHPGTRNYHIETLVNWCLNVDNRADRIAWLKGPAGVGKSAIAQTCAEALGEKLGAAFFFSRANRREDPGRFFTSIAYQLAVRFNSYGDLLDGEIHRDPTLVDKSLPHQFQDLLVAPFRELRIREAVAGRVIIVDGLDECAGSEAQVDIVKIVAESVREGTTPFLWIFLSRLEPDLVATFDLTFIKSASLEINLPISRDTDHEILLYLTDSLGDIGRKRGLPLQWPSKEDIWTLVNFSAGLFACAQAIIRFINEEDPGGPVGQLGAVLHLAKFSAPNGPKHPLSALNDLYTLIMGSIPPPMLQTVQWILLTTHDDVVKNANLLGLSELQFYNACRSLHSVMKIDDNKIIFYHTSFMDFLEDPVRSKGFCIWSKCAGELLDELLRKLDKIQIEYDPVCRFLLSLHRHPLIHYKLDRAFTPRLSITWPSVMTTTWGCHDDLVAAIFSLLSSNQLRNAVQLRLSALMDYNFAKACFKSTYLDNVQIELLLQNVGFRLCFAPSLLICILDHPSI